ncbi:reverse transcriptase [Cucumis melo var. makuwa]|uniref:Reverse transcriptase n=1 Tax=Cucumis melo var. makuwa TaxID=1194695 RepID=A0A5D3DUD2_CUCMM|nr:reverse transcriptase [Cucumis melo var. makuwa]TYK27114.1 reverse transcriptase [Cucumis melo var. makuwa]
MLAVVHCLRAWRQYLLGSSFVVKTDNSATCDFFTQTKLTSKQARWQELLAEFDFEFEHNKGSSNQAANALSRIQEHAAICLLAHNVMNLVKASKTRQFWVEEDLLVTKDNRLYVPRAEDLRKKFLYECHDTLWAGHLGWQQTYALLKKGYFWRNIRDDVMQYTKTCLICQHDKVEKVKVAGLLDSLPVPTRPWESVSMDFITHLPKVGDFEDILVIIDRFSKYATFIPTIKHSSAEMKAQLFFKHVVNLNISSSYHPQTDGQTEQFNYMLEEYLRHFINARQKNWVKLFDVAQFCFNAHTSSSIGRSPFEIVFGRQPVLPHLVDHPFAGKNPQALNFTKEWKQTNDIARAYLEKASKWMKKWADKKRRPLEFRTGDQKEDKDVEEILAERVRKGRRPARRIHEYLVKWKNLPVEATSWEHVEDLEAWKQKIEDFKLRHLTRTSTI